MSDTVLREELVDGIGPWVWPTEDTAAWYYLLRDWPSHLEKIRKHCRKFDVAVQAGGCTGLYPRLLAEIFKHVYTFEPDELNFRCLVQNVAGKNVYPMRAALGAESGKFVKVRRPHVTNCGMNTVTPAQRVAIPLMTVDQLELPECDLLMLDMEGDERPAVKGARATIKRCQPVIFVENGNDHKIGGYRWADTSWMDCIFLPYDGVDPRCVSM